jgi:homoserine O-acetyltransferase
MGGMATIEWPLCAPPGFVRSVIPIATAAKQSAWGISWSEVQRSCILEDPSYQCGHYLPNPSGQPIAGLSTARMVAMLTYRSSISFDNRFGRKVGSIRRRKRDCPIAGNCHVSNVCMSNDGSSIIPEPEKMTAPSSTKSTGFSAQSYLQYQGEKFLQRFDANCYLHLIDKMDFHDLTRGRPTVLKDGQCSDQEALSEILGSLPPKALVVGTETDLLFCPEQQAELAASIPEAELVVLPSQDGHDGFLLEFEALNAAIEKHLKTLFPAFYESAPFEVLDATISTRSSVFGELETS